MYNISSGRGRVNLCSPTPIRVFPRAGRFGGHLPEAMGSRPVFRCRLAELRIGGLHFGHRLAREVAAVDLLQARQDICRGARGGGQRLGGFQRAPKGARVKERWIPGEPHVPSLSHSNYRRPKALSSTWVRPLRGMDRPTLLP
jgi:hypothetical protein